MVERKYYDLTPSQKLMYFALKFIPQKNVVNIGTAVWFHENIDCELLKAAAYKAIWRMDALRLRLKKVKGQIKQYVSEGGSCSGWRRKISGGSFVRTIVFCPRSVSHDLLQLIPEVI